MFFSSKGLGKKAEFGRLYIFRFTLKDNTVIHKVGMCNSDRTVDRMMEVLRAFFMVYRYIPNCELRKNKKVRIPLLVEQHMHGLLDEWSYTFEKPFDGHTEFFINLDEDAVIEYFDDFKYEDLFTGKVAMKESDYLAIKKAVQSENPEPEITADDIPF